MSRNIRGWLYLSREERIWGGQLFLSEESEEKIWGREGCCVNSLNIFVVLS